MNNKDFTDEFTEEVKIRKSPKERHKEQHKITRMELVSIVHNKLDREYTWKTVFDIVRTVFQCIPEIIADGYILAIDDCFTLKPKIQKGRHGKARGKIEFFTKDHYVPSFTPHKKLKDACRSLPINKNKKSKQ